MALAAHNSSQNTVASIYEFTMAHIEQMERKINSHSQRWLGLPKCLSNAALYGNTTALHLPFRSLIKEFKVTKIRTELLYKLSKDEKVAEAGIEVCSGRKWKASRELQVAEEQLHEKAILGAVAKGHAGLGFFFSNCADKSSYKSKRRLIQVEVRKGEDEIRLTKMAVSKQQGAWTKWNSTMQWKIKWCEIRNDCANFKFLIRSIYDILPSLCIWNKTESALCPSDLKTYSEQLPNSTSRRTLQIAS